MKNPALRRVIRAAMILVAVLIGATGGEARIGGRALAADCAPATTEVVRAYKVGPDAPGDSDASDEALQQVQLDDVIELQLKNFKSLLAERDCRGDPKPVVLFLDGRPVSGSAAYPPTNPAEDKIRFVLKRTEASREVWTYVLGRPTFAARQVDVSIGIEDRYPVMSQAYLMLTAVPTTWFLVWAAVFLVIVGCFFALARKTSLLRGGVPAGGNAYSLSKTQAAWWFIVVLGAYLGIGLITGDYTSSINTTVLVLLGIGAGTAIGSAVIDASKTTDLTAPEQAAEADRLAGEVADLAATLRQMKARKVQLSGARALNADEGADLTRLIAQLGPATRALAAKRSALRKQRGQSEGVLIDIVSDANGVSFHRFQIAAWTVVLSIIFVKQVYQNLAMPTFDDTLLGLQALSAGTFLGMKLPEAVTPKDS